MEVTVQQIEAFKRENDLEPDEVSEAPGAADFDDEIDLRAEDDALIAAELEAEQARAEAAAAEEGEDEEDREDDEDEDEEGAARPRRRGRRGRGGRGRTAGTGRGASSALEGTFDHGEEGYGLWLDPAIEDNPVYAEHWAGHRPVEVTIEADRIVIRRAQAEGAEDDDE